MKDTINKVIIIAGPTASGKSNLALNLAQKVNGIIINADSSQVYKEAPILTSSPTIEDKNKVPHFLYNFTTLNHNFKVTEWVKLVKNILQKTNKIPIIVGGSGFYINILVNGISNIPEPTPTTLTNVNNLFKAIGLNEFKEKLKKIDPLYVSKFTDPYRLIKAYSTYLETNIPMSQWHQQPKLKLLNANFKIFNFLPNRIYLYNNINERFKKMIQEGAIEEAQHILNDKIDSNYYKKVIGLKELIEYLTQKITLEKAIELASQKTRNYAKRQITWFKNQLIKAEIIENNNTNIILNHILKKF